MTENVVRHTAEKGAAHAKDAYRRTQEAAGETTKVMEQTYSAASKGAADFNLHLLDITQANMNAAFDFARELTMSDRFQSFSRCRRRIYVSRSKH